MASKKKPTILVPDTLTGNAELDKGLEKLPEMTNADALDVALALQQLIRGQNSMLANQDKFGKQISELRERMDAYDRATEEYEANKEQYIEKILEKSDSLRRTGMEQDKIIAKGVNQYTEAVQNARASIATDYLKFEDMLRRMPKVTVTSPGKSETVMQGGTQVLVVVPEEIRIKNKRWILQPNVPTEVPEIVAEALKERRRLEEENSARSRALQKNMENNALIAEMNRIDRKFGITTQEN